MFTFHNKVKEQVMFFIKTSDLSCLSYKNNKVQPVGISVAMTYKYNVKDITIIYDKWFVESFDLAKEMNLQGCEHHNKLIQGSGVRISTQKLGTTTFYGKDAMDIVNACESKQR